VGGQRRFAEEYRLRRGDGGYIWVIDNAVAVERRAEPARAADRRTSADVDAATGGRAAEGYEQRCA
jgi:hypothetical protein